MKRSNSEQVGNVVMQYLRQCGLETPLYEFRVVDAWPRVVGEALASYTQDLNIYNQVLFVRVSSSVVRNELMMRRSDLVSRLNREAGAQVITQIVLR